MVGLTMFVDASAIVGMLLLEDGYETLADSLDEAETRVTSGMAIWEATIAISRGGPMMLDLARRDVAAFLAARAIEVVPIGAAEGQVALDAHRRFGKGRHPARLNMGDCFAYACAKTNGAELLYKGDDFSHTDLA